MKLLIVVNPEKRLSAEEALNHPWLKKKEFPIDVDKWGNESLMEHVRDNILSYARMSELRRIASVVVAHKSSSGKSAFLLLKLVAPKCCHSI